MSMEAANGGFLEKKTFLKIAVLKVTRWNFVSKSLENRYEKKNFLIKLQASSLQLYYKMNFFKRIFKEISLQISEHLQM